MIFDGRANLAALDAQGPRLRELGLRVALRRPGTTLRHLWDAGSMIWQIRRPRGTRYVMAPVEITRQGVRRIDPGQRHADPAHWDFSLHAVRRPMPPLFWKATRDSWSWLLWRPALPMYLLFLGALVARLRSGSWRYALLAVPAALQSAALALTCPATDFRYQWPVFLSGWLFAPFLLCSVRASTSASVCSGTPK